jgi:hypothetical protein
MKLSQFEPLLSIPDLAALLLVPGNIIRCMVAFRTCPAWTWPPSKKQPMWKQSDIPEWLRCSDVFDLTNLSKPLPPMPEHPERIFADSIAEPSEQELEIAARMCGVG